MKQPLLRVKFDELNEVKENFGYKSISPGGGVFPKHLIYSYDLKTKTVIFPFGWVMKESGGTNENNYKHAFWNFNFNPYCQTFFAHKKVKKMDLIEVDYDQKEFAPCQGLVLAIIFIQCKNKKRADKWIQKHLAAKTIIAQRSKKIYNTIIRLAVTKRVKMITKKIPYYVYELALKKSDWKNFAEELSKQELISKTDRFGAIILDYVFPKQLANFNKTE